MFLYGFFIYSKLTKQTNVFKGLNFDYYLQTYKYTTLQR